ncbi:MAG TPA: LPXTG cell wall anchor domain-containing protein [Fimbriimonadaceae bacterium]|nr:LPXTG cell wall anchor domain-containing protein [Fimbriimonadaceae bacterium]
MNPTERATKTGLSTTALVTVLAGVGIAAFATFLVRRIRQDSLSVDGLLRACDHAAEALDERILHLQMAS